MTLKRKEARNRAAEIIKNAGTAAAERVEAGRTKPAQKDQYPLVAIYAPSQQGRSNQEHTADFESEMQLVVEVRAKNADSASLADELDDLSEACLNALLAPTIDTIDTVAGPSALGFLGELDLAVSALLVEVDLDPEGDKNVGIARNVLTLGPWQEIYEPTASDDLGNISVKIDGQQAETFGSGALVDRLGNISDPNGTPLQTGPDDRTEHSFDMNLPTE